MPDAADKIALPFPVLIGDIGGTNARFAIVPDRDAPVEHFHPAPTGDFPNIEAAVEKSVYAKTKLRPKAALIDLAGPIVGDAVDLTNAAWIIRPRDMIASLGLQDVVLLNDFEALALALTALAPEDLVKIGGGEPSPTGAKVAIGPGTGLGVGGLVHAGGADGPWVPVPGEGGHVSLGPTKPDEFAVWPNITPENGAISAEVLLSGRGIVALYRAVSKTEGLMPRDTTPAEVTKTALDKSDPLAVRTLTLYARLLGRLAGDMTLVFMARGGAYIGGGIPPRILPFLTDGAFRRAFEQKPPHEHVMATIPLYVIVGENPALKGLAAFARAPERFGVNLSGRRWLK
jgi:glucokinase